MPSILLAISTSTLYTIIICAYFATMLGIIGVVVSENRNPVKSLAWILVLLLVPILGVVLYIFFGRNMKSYRMISRRNKRKLRRITSSHKKENIDSLPLSADSRQQLKLGHSLNGSKYYSGNAVEVFTDGISMFDALIEDIKNAKSYINMQFYIFEDDKIGNRMRKLLEQKASEGVTVRLLYDDVGCLNVKSKFFRGMQRNGIITHPFNPVTFRKFATRINWRNHRKITVIDGRIGYIGGMNIADRYINGGKHGVWRDTHLRITGPAVLSLQSSFAIDWTFMGNDLLSDITLSEKHGTVGIQLVTSGPLGPWSNISMTFYRLISNARHCIFIQTPYFLPTETLLKALQVAALSKVDVRIMIPDSSDSVMLNYASFSYVNECLASGIKIYRYMPGMLHAKMMIIDDECCTVGSTNFDFRSMEHNFEGNVILFDKDLNARMKDIFFNDLSKCQRITSSQWRMRPITQKFKESIVRLLSPIL